MTDSIRMIRRKTCDALIDSLNREPNLWRWEGEGDCVVRHVNGVRVWYWSFDAYLYSPRKVKFSWSSWVRLRRALKRWNRLNGKAQLHASEIQACLIVIDMFARGQVA